jgi:hypothetical protein
VAIELSADDDVYVAFRGRVQSNDDGELVITAAEGGAVWTLGVGGKRVIVNVPPESRVVMREQR